ncbi:MULTISPECIES: hypothetical protein [Chryseobacterium]|uniref:Uncharacterized protein n=1 Tax=Chryseobacterium geocarposphaerae TaxID=1416776 RepID=A0ABU1LDB1_9FLAO|nr:MULTISPECIES: hypothetical protein [Chryseobacterium]MDR6404701.1 hypothetical protein [Chryseobacterium geocarposphaerae]MDR6698066.1 hypothetical protein [Chryseobacterium ginsenosidimutans]
MAEELYFIKTNPVTAKINLYNKLCQEEQDVLNYLDDDKKTSLELIKKKVLENVENLSKEELLNLFNWFNAKCNGDHEELKTQLFVHGIDIFHEILSPSNVQSFQQILSDYEKYSQRITNHIFDPEKFNQFLIYGIFFTGFINKEKGEEYILADFLKSDYKNLYSHAEEEFNSKKTELLSQENIYNHFTDLYDCTKFYKNSIIKLQANS